MKTLLLLFLLPLFSTAQNWSVFNSHDHYNYKEAGAPLITNVLFADSFKVDGTDTLYYTNRIAREFTTSWGQFNDTGERNLPQFLHAVIRRSVNGVYTFYDDTIKDFYRPDTFAIQTLANAGDSWVYDSTAGIISTVDSIFAITQFGISDSAKQIGLSNGDKFLLSKSFGLLSFTADTIVGDSTKPLQFTLQGIEMRNLGDSVINFWNVYNFDVGDVFFSVENFYGPDPYTLDYVENKQAVISKVIYPDSISYTFSDIFYSVYDADPTNPWANPPRIYGGRDTFPGTYINSPNNLSNLFPGQYTDSLYGLDYSFDTLGKSCASLVLDPVFLVPCKAAYNFFNLDSDNYVIFHPYADMTGYYCVVCAGLGVTHSDVSFFEAGDQFDITAWTHNGITYGIMPTDSELLALAGIGDVSKPQVSVHLFPNPARDKTNIFISGVSNTNALIFSLYDLTGRQVLSARLTGIHTSIDCRMLPSAVYVWRVSDVDENVLQSGKLVKE
jgi:hypothetical protein